MRKLLLVAATLSIALPAQAQTFFSFDIGGQPIHIGVGNNCWDISCIVVGVPGYAYTPRARRSGNTHPAQPSNPKRSKQPPTTVAAKGSADPASAKAETATQKPQTVAAAETGEQRSVSRSIAAAPALAEPARDVAAPAPELAVEPNRAPAPQADRSASSATATAAEPTAVPAQAAVSTPPADAARAADAAPPSAAAKTQTPPADTSIVVAARTPDQQPIEQTPQSAPAPATPIGLWSSNEGQIRIEPCGSNLCGYATGKDAGKMVLINMQPTKHGWSGRVHDIRGGGIYASTIAMRGPNSLRLEGCAMGGLFCGSRILTRVKQPDAPAPIQAQAPRS